MAIGWRYIALAAVGWLTLAAAPAPNNSAQPEQPNADRRVGDALTNITSAYNKQAERTESAQEHQPCGPRQYQSKDDLCAQWKAADAAADAAGWAKLGIWFSGISLLAVVGAILLTIESNKIARAAANRGLRAYLGIEKVHPIPHAEGMVGKIDVKNYGQTPAYDVVVNLKAGIAPFGTFDLSTIDNEEAPEERLAVLNPMAANEFAVSRDYPGFRRAITDEEMGFFVHGSIEYRDVFGSPHRIDFAYRGYGETVFTRQWMMPCLIGNKYTQPD